CVGNFFLIEKILQPHFSQSLIITSGVFFAGLFSFFGKVSILFTEHKSTQYTWKVWAEELIMPLAATAFVGAWAFQTYSPTLASGMTFFVLAFFVFAGKLLLSQLSVLKNDWKEYQHEQRFEKNRSKELQAIAVDLSVINVKLHDWNEEMQQLGEKMAPFATEIARTEARRDMLIKIFESEFYLSRNYKSILSDKQINKLKLG
ncbi:MAG: hypothetical protein H7Y04_15075, partial [Verrucomicrobia bacterium]|nr:hypothetical protein [Cytophagales bacterium]